MNQDVDSKNLEAGDLVEFGFEYQDMKNSLGIIVEIVDVGNVKLYKWYSQQRSEFFISYKREFKDSFRCK